MQRLGVSRSSDVEVGEDSQSDVDASRLVTVWCRGPSINRPRVSAREGIMRRKLFCAALFTALLALTSCARDVASGSYNDMTGAMQSSSDASAADQGLTTSEVLSVWQKALKITPHPIIIVGYGSTTQIGQWELSNGNNKQALLSRLATLAPSVVDAGAMEPTTGSVAFASGTTQVVRLLDAQHTAQLLINESGSQQPCDRCTPVVLTSPQPTTASVTTATGPATVPAWSFGVQGSSVRLVQASIDPAQLLQKVPGLPHGLGDAQTTVHVESGGNLTVRWVGAPSVAQAGGCGADYRFEFLEGTDVVVLRFVELPSTATQTPQACAAYATTRSATVRPPQALGSRLLVQDRTGFVVPRV